MSQRLLSRRWSVALLLLFSAVAAVTIAGANAASVGASFAEPNLLPPAPGDDPTVCGGDEPPYSPCGVGRYCSPVDDASSTSYCLHGALFPFSPTWRDAAALILIAGCCFLAAMAGIGGGGLLFPVIILIWGFTPKEASVLSHAGVFGNTLGQLIFYIVRSWRRREGEESTGLYAAVAGAVMMILPGLLAGGSAAISMQGLFPSTAILILALLTLLLGVTKTFVKARSMWKKEEDAALVRGEMMSAGGRSDEDSTASHEEAFAYESMDADADDTRSAKGDSDALEECSYHSSALENIPDAEPETAGARSGTCSPLRCTVEKLIASCWVLDALTFLTMRGSAGIVSIQKCSPAYFIIVFLPLAFAVLFVSAGRSILWRQRESEEREREEREAAAAAESSLVEKTDAWEENPPSVVQGKEFNILAWWLPVASFFIGLFSALLGIGGGEILGPILLLLNMNAKLSSTTTSIIALLNSGTNNLHNALAGAIISPGYFLIVWSTAMAAGGAGRSLVMTISARSGKDSIIAFSLAFLLTIAACLVAFELFSTPPDWGTEGVC